MNWARLSAAPGRVHNGRMLWLWLLACDVTLYANLPEAPSPDAVTDVADTVTGDTGVVE